MSALKTLFIFISHFYWNNFKLVFRRGAVTTKLNWTKQYLFKPGNYYYYSCWMKMYNGLDLHTVACSIAKRLKKNRKNDIRNPWESNCGHCSNITNIIVSQFYCVYHPTPSLMRQTRTIWAQLQDQNHQESYSGDHECLCCFTCFCLAVNAYFLTLCDPLNAPTSFIFHSSFHQCICCYTVRILHIQSNCRSWYRALLHLFTACLPSVR